MVFRGMPTVWRGRHRLILCWLVFMQAVHPGRKTLEPTFKGVWYAAVNFAPLPLLDTRPVNTHSLTDDQMMVLDAMDLQARSYCPRRIGPTSPA